MHEGISVLGIISIIIGFVLPNYSFIVLGLVIFGLSGLRIIRPFEKGSVERLGRFTRVKSQGIMYIIPFIEKVFKVLIAEELVDVKPQEVITKDNLNAKVDAQVYIKVKSDDDSVYNALYKAEDYKNQIVNLARTTLRDVVGNMMFEDANSKRGTINKSLHNTLSKEASSWGIDIVRTEIAEIEPPKDVQDTMNRILKANNEKVANKDFAEARKIEASGIKLAEIEKAMGVKRSTILRAEGQAEAIESIAKANAERIKLVNTSADKFFRGNAKILKRLETTESALKKGSKFVVPRGASLVNVISEASGITPLPIKK